MRFGYGLITAQRPPDDPRTDADLYREIVERCVIAEASGFDSAWVSEHHFLDDGYMPSLLTTCAAIAQATRKIEIGTAVLLAPLHSPVRIAEDAATVDLISGGRFILGLGAGWRGEEFDGFGVDQRQRPERMRETVRVCRTAWGPGTLEYPKGSGQQLNVTPKPAHDIPIWLGGFAPAAIARAGRIADGFLGSSSGTSGIDAFVRAKDIALEARAKAGRSTDDFSFALHVPAYVGEWDEVKPYYTYLRWKYADMAEARASTTAKSPGPVNESQLKSTIMCGSTNEIVDEVGRFREALGDDIHFIFRCDFPGMPQEQQVATIQKIGVSVIGQFR